MIPIEVTRAAWSRAAKFPPNKEAVYYEHAVVQEFALHIRERVLEYGCGGGSDALSYLRRQNRVWYADVVPDNVEAATRRIAQAGLAREAYPVVLEASAPIPLAAETMDVINAHGVLHHIEDPAPVLAEFARILKVGGQLYVMLYTEHLWAKHQRTIELLVRSGRCHAVTEAFGWCTDEAGTPYARAYTEAEGRGLIEASRLTVESVRLYNDREFRTFKARKMGRLP